MKLDNQLKEFHHRRRCGEFQLRWVGRPSCCRMEIFDGFSPLLHGLFRGRLFTLYLGDISLEKYSYKSEFCYWGFLGNHILLDKIPEDYCSGEFPSKIQARRAALNYFDDILLIIVQSGHYHLLNKKPTTSVG